MPPAIDLTRVHTVIREAVGGGRCVIYRALRHEMAQRVVVGRVIFDPRAGRSYDLIQSDCSNVV